MSFDLFFGMSQGLAKPLRVPRGTLASILEHIEGVENLLGLVAESHSPDQPARWREPDFSSVTDEDLCGEAEHHNAWVRRLHADFCRWHEEPTDGEELTPEAAKAFWHGLEPIDVPPARWTASYCRARLEALYEALRGRDAEGAYLDATPLSVEQADAVIGLVSEYLDPYGLNLRVPRGHDVLESSLDGGYDYCDKCGVAVLPDERAECSEPGCPLREDDDGDED